VLLSFLCAVGYANNDVAEVDVSLVQPLAHHVKSLLAVSTGESSQENAAGTYDCHFLLVAKPHIPTSCPSKKPLFHNSASLAQQLLPSNRLPKHVHMFRRFYSQCLRTDVWQCQGFDVLISEEV
jgi:hypothetical protein